MTKLFTLKGVTVTEQIKDSVGKFRTVGSKHIGLSGKIQGLSKFTRGSLVEMGKWTVLAKTSRFMPAMGLMGLAGLGLGYLLGNSSCKKDEDMGLIVEKEDKPAVDESKNKEQPEALVEEYQTIDYHSINTAGYSWKTIVENYYPGLVDKCEGKIYGKDGAIRMLKEALSKCDDIDLINASDIPKTLNLPLTIDGVSINTKATPTRSKIKEGGGHINIKEAGCKNIVSKFRVKDTKTGDIYEHKDLNTALDSLKSRTNVEEYKLKAN